MVQGKKLTIYEFVYAANKIHKDKYDYSLVNFINTKTKIKIICKCGNIFLQQPDAHLRGQGCKKCADKNKMLSQEDFIKKANKIHNNKYDYSKSIYSGNNKKIIIICHDHDIKFEFKQKTNDHLQGHGCPKCGNVLKNNINGLIESFNKIHNYKYDYSKINYINNKVKIKIICKKHGEFLQSPSHHINGHGCKKCADKNKQLSLNEFISNANNIHDFSYDYSLIKEYCGSKNKVQIICNNHKEPYIFLQSPHVHLRGRGCNKCSHIISKGEVKWLQSFKNSNIIYNKTFVINNKLFKVDGFDPETNTVYEFYGDYWHGNPKIYDNNLIHGHRKNKDQSPMTYGEVYCNTIKRERELIGFGFKLVTIWENDFNKL